MDDSDNKRVIATEEMLAFVEGFLLGLARRLDDAAGGSFYKGAEAADDCRAVAKSIGRVRVPMERVVPKASP